MSTPGYFRFPVRTADVWGLNDEEERGQEDIAADLDYQDNAIEAFLSDITDASNVATFGQSLDRGREPVTFVSTTTYSSGATFTNTFSAVPRVVLTPECGRSQDIRAITVVVTTTGFSYLLTNSVTSTATAYVHWVAVSQ